MGRVAPAVMPAVEDYDELVMRLLESAMKHPPEDRKRYLQFACPSPDVFEDVWMRVEWEQRMGSFLLEPLRFDHDPTLQPGVILGNRFRITREVGRGGMGIVYEAVDEKLDRRVAVKCALTGFGNRMPPEARAAREVSHFNVCKVHDLHVASTRMGEIEFLSMEFIEGETMAAHIQRTGPMSPVDARDLGRQICAGLAQLHRQGVIHGDLKCGNIILARAPEGGLRPVITDFGLAKLKTNTNGSHRMSGQGGTFDYMAPELRLGGQISVCSDIYALGVVFHTMLAGKEPKQSGITKVMERLSVAAPSAQTSEISPELTTQTVRDPARAIVNEDWRREIANLPYPWKKIVTKCLAPRPDDRFSSVAQVEHALKPRPAIFQWVWSVLAVIAVLLWGQFRESSGEPPVRLAILPSIVEGPPIASAVGIVTDVARRLSGLHGKLIVISPAEALRNGVDAPHRAKSVLGATHVLRTRLWSSGVQIAALASIVDLSSGQIVREMHGTYATSDTALLAKALTATVTGAFGLRSGVPQESVSGPAYPVYVQGLTLMLRDKRSANEAIPFFNKAIEIDPKSALPYAGLAEAQIQKYQRGDGRQWLDKAMANIAKAKSINPDAVPVLLTSGILQQEHGWYEQASREFSRAADLEPNNAEAWRLLASIYDKTNRTEEAIATYRRAIEAQPSYYRHYFDFGNFHYARGHFQEAEELYRRVVSVAPNLAAGHNNLGLALMEQGRYTEAENSLLHALHLNRSPSTLMNVGAFYYQEENFERALSFFQASLASEAPTAFQYADLGDAYRHLGRIPEATEAYRNAGALAEEQLADNPRQAYVRVLLAQVSARLGDPRRAEFELRQALALEPENAIVTHHSVITYEILEQRERALDLLRSAPVLVLEKLLRSPDAKDLCQDPRFQELIQREATQAKKG
jgi:serine/threonine protein kinase/tetratricopeptide (TPR) repeat protein